MGVWDPTNSGFHYHHEPFIIFYGRVPLNVQSLNIILKLVIVFFFLNVVLNAFNPTSIILGFKVPSFFSFSLCFPFFFSSFGTHDQIGSNWI